jgi:hypothetical protein
VPDDHPSLKNFTDQFFKQAIVHSSVKITIGNDFDILD